MNTNDKYSKKDCQLQRILTLMNLSLLKNTSPATQDFFDNHFKIKKDKAPGVDEKYPDIVEYLDTKTLHKIYENRAGKYFLANVVRFSDLDVD